MRVVLQRVTFGTVAVAGQVIGQVDRGFVALVGIAPADTPAQADLLATKTAHVRVFDDADGKMNLSVLDVGGGVLVVSQFTLYADLRRGRRPGFSTAAGPAHAAPLVDHFAARLTAEGVTRVETGQFGAMMAVTIHNDGPVTLLLDTDDLT